MKKSKIKHILLFILLFITIFLFFSTRWALNTFAFINFNEVIFQLTSPIKSTESSILVSFFSSSLVPTIIVCLITYLLLKELFKLLKNKYLEFNLKLFGKKIIFNIKTNIIKILLTILLIITPLLIIYYCLNKITLIDYIKVQSQESKFIENNYIDPDKVNIKFPDNKKNLIFIYAESLESTYFSKDLGGESSANYMEPITNKTLDNLNFSDTDKIGGAIGVPGTTWTTSGMVAHTAGIPLKVNADITNDYRVSSLLKGATALGDILEKEGYNQMLMIGSDKSFGNRGIYFKQHGNYKVYDYYTAIKKGKITEDYYEWWGFEDSKYFNSISCSINQINNFIDWIMKQDFYNNTTIIVVGDHISMQPDLYPNYTKRRIYNLFINSSISTNNNKNRLFTTMDLFPTTLSSLGVEIEGDKLGLGTNLFSDKKTLIEETGVDKFNIEIDKYSKFYINNLLEDKKSTS